MSINWLIKKFKFMNILVDKISTQSKVCLIISLIILACLFGIQSLIVFRVYEPSYNLALIDYICVVVFMIPFSVFIRDFLLSVKNNEKELLKEVLEKNTYLEHAAKILRHDMHSGLNTYIPRGIKSLERRMPKELVTELKLESPLRLLKEGLAHSQQVYKGVYEFTNLVRKDATLQLELTDIGEALEAHLKRTSYSDQVILSEDLPTINVNEALFCTAIDNLIRNGLKYNDSLTKQVKIEMIDTNTIGVIDNGRGLSCQDFKDLCKPYARKINQKEIGSGLGLNICVAILKEHGFSISAQKLQQGTMIKVGINNGND